MTNERALELLRIARSSMASAHTNDDDIVAMYDRAINALEKQIPKYPICNGNRTTSNRCPSCNARLKSGRGSSCWYRNHWCNHCGQAIVWDD